MVPTILARAIIIRMISIIKICVIVGITVVGLWAQALSPKPKLFGTEPSFRTPQPSSRGLIIIRVEFWGFLEGFYDGYYKGLRLGALNDLNRVAGGILYNSCKKEPAKTQFSLLRNLY